MARLEGFEPPTNRIGTCYSIQLSYRRTLRSVCGGVFYRCHLVSPSFIENSGGAGSWLIIWIEGFNLFFDIALQ